MKSAAILFSLAFAALSAQAQNAPGQAENANPDNPLLAPDESRLPTRDDGVAHGQTHPVTASDAPPEFPSVDTNADGVLSIEEVRQALPDLVVVDINSDGLVNHAEAENALPGLHLTEEGQRASSDAAVGRLQYALIVQHLADQEVLSGSLSSEASDEALSSEDERSTAGLGR